ncbi:hypothetical protein [Roseateles asaccharophilus]|uniref:Uncharacterized protein n=1 Tax=Roseateles asaccharophilus TaxID=582607 RepID=A0ABU2A6A9_9BURK|nr:hypothetical protein [Roseateles asaccharophilus]MDR7332686.1 hypothetical protein [Roseateles asaccharophilus]
MKPLTRAVLWGGLLAGTGELVFALAFGLPIALAVRQSLAHASA